MSTEVLNKLLVSEIPQVAEAAQRAQLLTAELTAGKLTKDEFDELIDDLTSIDNIDRAMITLEWYREIAKAFQIIMTLKSLTSLL